MLEVILTGFGIDIVEGVLAAVAAWGALRLLDLSAKVTFKKAYARLFDNPIALGIYLGLRFLGICVLFVAVVG